MSTKVVTGRVRLSYVHVAEPFSFEDEDPKYSVMLLIPKSDKKTMAAIRKAEKAAAEIGKSTKFGGSIPKDLLSIVKDGDDEDIAADYPERAGHWYMTVRSNSKPELVDADVNPILEPNAVYSGCYARVSMSAFPYKFGGNKGTSFGLNNIQKIADGEPLGGITRAEDDFGEYEDESDDDLV